MPAWAWLSPSSSTSLYLTSDPRRPSTQLAQRFLPGMGGCYENQAADGGETGLDWESQGPLSTVPRMGAQVPKGSGQP